MGHKLVGDVTRQDLERTLASIMDEGKSGALRVQVYNSMNMMMDYALGPDGPDCRPVVAGTPKRVRTTKPPTDAELSALLDPVPPRMDAYVDTMATLGLRPQECAALMAEQFEEDLSAVGVDRVATVRVDIRHGTKT